MEESLNVFNKIERNGVLVAAPLSLYVDDLLDVVKTLSDGKCSGECLFSIIVDYQPGEIA